MSRDRYAQCDDTCTVDCGACKGAGRPMTADLTPAQAARLAAIEAAPYAEEACVERVAAAIHEVDSRGCGPWTGCPVQDEYRRLAGAAIDVMRGAADDGAIGRVEAKLAELERHRTEIQDHANATEVQGATFCGGRALGIGEAIDTIRAAMDPR